ncbi:MAG: response regulator [Gammaproteobacteria bacterium]|nr:response regulator [Gammaproteobacteria bacterium]
MARILLVEDNEDNRDMLARRLQRKEHEVIVAVNGQEGVDKAQSEMPDIILMDMSMPVMDGWEATRLLKADTNTTKIPVIGLSAHALKQDYQKALDAGCDDYEIKPVVLNQLLEKIEKHTA